MTVEISRETLVEILNLLKPQIKSSKDIELYTHLRRKLPATYWDKLDNTQLNIDKIEVYTKNDGKVYFKCRKGWTPFSGIISHQYYVLDIYDANILENEIGEVIIEAEENL